MIINKDDKPFIKDSLSQNKPIMSAISPKMLLGVGKVLAIGAEKYGRDNWKKCKEEDLHLYWDALYRHLNAYNMGELVDKDTNLSHLYHAVCNMQFIIELDTKIK